MTKIAPSILSGNFLSLGPDIEFLNENADLIHVDVMDGTFVPNISFGFPVMDAVAKVARIPMDVHLMIVHPEKYVDRFASSGAEMISFHLEAADDAGTDPRELTGFVRGAIAQLDAHVEPGDIPVRTFGEELGREYETERKLSVIVGLFTLLAVVIALMGVFGIVLFETQHRRREVAVRKVMGATTGEILRMFNRRYLAMAAVCFAAAVPVSVWAVFRWLSQFAYRTPLAWWVFAAALAAVVGITALTVSARSWHAANENPADSVKSE